MGDRKSLDFADSFMCQHSHTATEHPACYKKFLAGMGEDVYSYPSLEAELKVEHELKTSDDCVRVIPLSDIHLGASNGSIAFPILKGTINYILKHPNAYTIIGGDVWDGTSHFTHLHPSPYSAATDSTGQYLAAEELLKPLAEKGKILGAHRGHHDSWLYEEKGLDTFGLLCKNLNIPYLTNGARIRISVNKKQVYDIYSLHPKGGASTDGGRISSSLRKVEDVQADMYLISHFHIVDAIRRSRFMSNGTHRKYYLVWTGTFLQWERSYAQEWGLRPNSPAVSKLKFFADKWDMHVSI